MRKKAETYFLEIITLFYHVTFKINLTFQLNFFFSYFNLFKFLDFEIPCVRDEVPTIFERMLFEREDVCAASLIYSRLYVRVHFIRSDNGYITYDMRSVAHISCLHLFIFLGQISFWNPLPIRILFVDNDHRCHKKKTLSFASWKRSP